MFLLIIFRFDFNPVIITRFNGLNLERTCSFFSPNKGCYRTFEAEILGNSFAEEKAETEKEGRRMGPLRGSPFFGGAEVDDER